MAITGVGELQIPETWFPYVREQSTNLSKFFRSGVVEPDARIQQFCNGGGQFGTIPILNDLDGDDNVSHDEAAAATPHAMSSVKELAVRFSRNIGYSSADLAAELAGHDPLMDTGDRIARKWARRFDALCISIAKGIKAENTAADAKDMIYDFGGIPALLTAEAILEAQQTMGDMGDELVAIAMHSASLNILKKANLISFIPDSEGRVRFQTFMGLEVIVHDQLTPDTGVYTAILFARGFYKWGEGTPKTPIAFERTEAAGNGGGIEELWTRREFSIHPTGHQALAAGITGSKYSPSNADCEAAAMWNRITTEQETGDGADRKLCPIAFLDHTIT